MNNRETSVMSLALLVSMLSIQGVTQIDTDFGMVWGGDKESVLYICNPKTATAEVGYNNWYVIDGSPVVDVVVLNHVEFSDANGTYVCKVTGIEEWGFSEYNFSSIQLPEGLLYIGDHAFFDARLKSKSENGYGCIVFPENLDSIGKNAFEEAGINYEAYNLEGELIDDEVVDDECVYIPVSQDIKTYKFKGSAPTFIGTNAFACGLLDVQYDSTGYYSTGGSALVFKKEYIDTYTNDFDSAGLWHGLLGNPKLVITAISNDVAKGELTLAWTPSNVYEEVVHPLILDGRKFSVWRSSEDPRIAYDDFSSASNIAQHVTTTNYVDKTFGDFRGTKPVMYWIEFEDVGEEVEQEEPTGMRRRPILEPSSCVTRRRFGLAVGVGDFAVPLTKMVQPKVEASLFAKLMRESPSVMDAANDVTVLINEQATAQGIGTAWRAFTDGNRLHPGDVMVFYAISHAGINNSGDYHFYAYDRRYSSTELWADMAEFKTRHSGVALINIFMTCHSGAVIPDDNSENIAWITSCKKEEESPQLSKEMSEFGNAFLEWGWNEGWAYLNPVVGVWKRKVSMTSHDGDLNFYDLVQYTFGLVSGRSSKVCSHVQMRNETLLQNVNVRSLLTKKSKDKPLKIYGLKAETLADGSVRLMWKLRTHKYPYFLVEYGENLNSKIEFFLLCAPFLQQEKRNFFGNVWDGLVGDIWYSCVINVGNQDLYNGLVKGSTYNFLVRRVNEVGYGDASDIVVVKAQKDSRVVIGKNVEYKGPFMAINGFDYSSMDSGHGLTTVKVSNNNEILSGKVTFQFMDEEEQMGNVVEFDVDSVQTVEGRNASLCITNGENVLTATIDADSIVGKFNSYSFFAVTGDDDESSVEGFPEVESDEDVGNALSGTESALQENITTKEEYDAFRSWAQSVKRADGSTAGVQAVKESTRAWLSFALGTDTLIGKEIKSDDVRIVSFQVEGGNDEMISSSSHFPTFIFEVAIDGVKIGSGVVAEEILKSNLKKVLAVEGSTQLDATTFSSDSIEIMFEPPVDGRARFMATTPSRLGNTFFMRLKVR